MATRASGWQARVGELAVYPGQGVAVIEALRVEEIAGQTREFLVLRKVEDDARILIPRENVGQVGLRGVMSSAEAERIWDILKTRSRRKRAGGITWSRQFREYQDKIRTGSIFDIAEVLRDLMRLQAVKELSFGERRVLDAARSLLVQELAACEDLLPEKVEAQIDSIVL